jgi:hypothetical protein
MLAQQELDYAKKKGLPDSALEAVNAAQRFIIEAIGVCEETRNQEREEVSGV